MYICCCRCCIFCTCIQMILKLCTVTSEDICNYLKWDSSVAVYTERAHLPETCTERLTDSQYCQDFFFLSFNTSFGYMFLKCYSFHVFVKSRNLNISTAFCTAYLFPLAVQWYNMCLNPEIPHIYIPPTLRFSEIKPFQSVKLCCLFFLSQII